MDCEPDSKAHRRLNAIHLLLLGATYDPSIDNLRRNLIGGAWNPQAARGELWSVWDLRVGGWVVAG